MLLVRVVDITDSNKLNFFLDKIGCDDKAFGIFESKNTGFGIYIYDLPFYVASLLKQEMLSRDGDAVVNKGVITAEVKASDVLLIGTLKSYRLLIEKLKTIPYWNLKDLAEKISFAIKSYFSKEKILTLPSGRKLVCGKKTLIMGILNITPDSFYSKSRVKDEKQLLEKAQNMIENDVDILDIGAESTRPGALEVPLEEELNRIIPAVKLLRSHFPKAVISVDTYKWEVANKALEAGADMINDIYGLRYSKQMALVVADWKVPVVIMHMKGTPKDMQKNPFYEDVIKQIMQFFKERIDYAVNMGIDENQIILDPGIGFGKRLQDNYDILNHLESFKGIGRPILIGHSRKSFIGNTLSLSNPDDRLYATIGVSVFASLKGADILRVHDVFENLSAVRMIESIIGK